ncbi:MAG: sugar ABC transporter ATP-binding protein [Eubacteriales bacterium]|nr:sugar ABC transporter ATP-binding protein [Eubacteriales bacterium]
MAENKKIMELKSITKEFFKNKALDNVSIDVYENEILAICGENGAGKSTLMKIVSGAYSHKEYTGDIYIDGKLENFEKPADSAAAGIAMIYQELSMHLDSSIAENLFLGEWINKHGIVSDKKMREETREFLKPVGLEDMNPRIILRNLSASQQQLVAIARALKKRPKILLLDEPTSPLTINESKRLFLILKELKKNGVSSILITHKMDEVFENADRIYVIRDGQCVSEHLVAETNRDQIVEEMVGRKFDNYYPKEEIPLGEVVFEVKDITVPHPFMRNKNIVENASFSLRRGEILGIAGLVGAGRSEFVGGIYGKYPRKSGKIFLDGKEIRIRTPEDALRYGIALLTEERRADGIISGLSIRDNITLASLKKFSRYGVMNNRAQNAETEKVFERLNIKANSIHVPAFSLSGGNQQKMVIAKWLMRDPKIIIMDEPTRGVDVGAKREIYTIMTDLVKRGFSIVIISSELPEIVSMADRVIVIAGGKITGELSRENLSQNAIMQLAV